MTTIPQLMPWLGEAEIAAVSEAVASLWITEGPRCAALNEQLKALIGAPYGVFAPNGTLALYLALTAAGIGPGDEVIVPDITFIASANAVLMAGATPVLADVSATTYQLEATHCAPLLSPRTRALMPVHLYGMCANMDDLMPFARAHNLLVIEDAAQAIGVYFCGRHAGSFGDFGCFSFFADKTITMGEGGYIACQDEAHYERLCLLRNQGRMQRGSFIHPEVGYNFRITDIQAALGLAQLARLAHLVEYKLERLAWYQEALAGLDTIRFLPVEEGSSVVPFRAVLLCQRAHELMAFLDARGIQPRSFFYPLHRQPCYSTPHGPEVRRQCAYPNADAGYEQGVLLPIYPSLTRQQVRQVTNTIKEFYHG